MSVKRWFHSVRERLLMAGPVVLAAVLGYYLVPGVWRAFAERRFVDGFFAAIAVLLGSAFLARFVWDYGPKARAFSLACATAAPALFVCAGYDANFRATQPTRLVLMIVSFIVVLFFVFLYQASVRAKLEVRMERFREALSLVASMELPGPANLYLGRILDADTEEEIHDQLDNLRAMVRRAQEGGPDAR